MQFKALRFRNNQRLRRAAVNNPWMKKDEAGKAVRLIQQALIDLGYALPKSTKKFGSPDGMYGDETKAMVLKYQKDRGLAGRDGVVGAETLVFLDVELEKKPWTALDDLPGESKDDLDKSIQFILATLGSGHIAGLNYTINWRQTWTIDPNDSRTRIPIVPSEHKTLKSSATAHRFQKIAAAVSANKLEVEIVPSLSVAAKYDLNSDAFLIRNAIGASVHDKTLIVHEAAHAVCDLNAEPLNGAFSEAVAFTAQAIYSRRAFGARPVEPDASLEPVMLKADVVARQAAGHGTVVRDDFDALVHAIVQVQAYRTAFEETHRYNGIPGV